MFLVFRPFKIKRPHHCLCYCS